MSRKFSDEIKAEAVRLHLEEGWKQKDVAEHLGMTQIYVSLLARKAKREPNRKCEYEPCGKAFWVPESTPGVSRFCSIGCYDAVRRREPVRCQQCGRDFQPNHGTRKYCSRACYQAKPPLPRAEEVPPRQCARCLNWFTPGYRRQRFCGWDCYHQASRGVPRTASAVASRAAFPACWRCGRSALNVCITKNRDGRIIDQTCHSCTIERGASVAG